jgi:glycogen debranching enzyme
LLNFLATQQPDGRMPGVIWMREAQPSWSATITHPPVWPVALQAHADHTGSPELIATGLDHLIRQIGWFEAHRQAEPFGFYYADVVHGGWESGVDEGVRFLEVQACPRACIDATTHVYSMYEYAARWAETLGQASADWQKKAGALRAFIQSELFDDETGFFYDAWAVRDRPNRSTSYEGMWPVVLGAATAEQAARVIGDHLLSPQRFLASHPITSVSQEDRHFELRMWHGPAWNSMTYWAATGCQRYGAPAAASLLLESALDDAAKQFAQTGTIWEFYHPHGGQPAELQRKPHTPFNVPCRDYLGHNPLLAMAALLEETRT